MIPQWYVRTQQLARPVIQHTKGKTIIDTLKLKITQLKKHINSIPCEYIKKTRCSYIDILKHKESMIINNVYPSSITNSKIKIAQYNPLGKTSLLQKQTVLNNFPRFATKKAGGSVKNTADSAGRRLGIKATAGELVKEGYIIVRQRGRKYIPGQNVISGKDFTLHSKINGRVVFTKMRIERKSKTPLRCFVNVIPSTMTSEQGYDATVNWMASFIKRHRDSIRLGRLPKSHRDISTNKSQNLLNSAIESNVPKHFIS